MFYRSTQGSWWEQHEGPSHNQASEYVQTETKMVILSSIYLVYLEIFVVALINGLIHTDAEFMSTVINMEK